MEISGPLPPAQAPQEMGGSAPLQLQVGQILQAVARGVTPEGLLQLRVGRQDLLARTGLAVPPGQTLTLQVARAGATPELRLIAPASPESVKAEALRQILPRMLPVAEALERLLQAGAPGAQETPWLAQPSLQPTQSPLSPEVQQVLQRFAAQLPRVQDVVSAPGLKAALLMSGLFSEALGVQGRRGPADLKTALQRLATLLRSPLTALPVVVRTPPGLAQAQAALPAESARAERLEMHADPLPSPSEVPRGARLLQELTHQVEGALSRIQLNQIVSLPQDDPSSQIWQLDLPVRCGERLDSFQLQVEEDRSGPRGTGGTAAWSVRLSFDLAPLGPVQVRIGLTGETISSTFWAEQPQTAALIGRRLDELRSGFERVGLGVGRLNALSGQPPAGPPGPTLPPLLDEQV